MSLVLPACEFCENFIRYDAGKGMVCKAFPDGIPDTKNIYKPYETECASGYKYEGEKPEEVTYRPDSMMAKMIRI